MSGPVACFSTVSVTASLGAVLAVDVMSLIDGHHVRLKPWTERPHVRLKSWTERHPVRLKSWTERNPVRLKSWTERHPVRLKTWTERHLVRLPSLRSYLAVAYFYYYVMSGPDTYFSTVSVTALLVAVAAVDVIRLGWRDTLQDHPS